MYQFTKRQCKVLVKDNATFTAWFNVNAGINEKLLFLHSYAHFISFVNSMFVTMAITGFARFPEFRGTMTN